MSAQRARTDAAPRLLEDAKHSNGSLSAAQLLTPDQLAERWSVSKQHIYRLAREGRIPVVSIGRYYRFRLPTIEAWEAAQEASSDG